MSIIVSMNKSHYIVIIIVIVFALGAYAFYSQEDPSPVGAGGTQENIGKCLEDALKILEGCDNENCLRKGEAQLIRCHALNGGGTQQLLNEVYFIGE